MDSQSYVEYELVNPATDRRITTSSREEAIAYFDEDWIVYEHHVTVGRPSRYASMRAEMSVLWNNNPEFNLKEDNEV